MREGTSDDMRTIDTSGLTRLGGAGDGPWRLDEGLLLRDHVNRHPMRSQEEAQASYDAFRAAWEAGIGSGEPLEVVRTTDGWGFVVEYVRGMDVQAHLTFGSFTPAEAARGIGAMQRRMHEAHMVAGLDWKDIFRGFVHDLEPLLPADRSARLRALVESVPDADALLHGDLHIGNVIVHGGQLTPIDLERVGFGHPMFDLAISCSRMKYIGFEQPVEFVSEADLEAFRRNFWPTWLQEYVGPCDEGDFDRLKRVLDVLGEVERSCFTRVMPTGREEMLANPLWRRQIDHVVELIDQVPRDAERLWAKGGILQAGGGEQEEQGRAAGQTLGA